MYMQDSDASRIEESEEERMMRTQARDTQLGNVAADKGSNALEASYEKEIMEYMLDLPRAEHVLNAQHDRWHRAIDGHNKWAEVAKTCQEFLEGNQWTEAEKHQLAEEGRPIITLNKIKPLVFLIAGFYRQNKYEDRIYPSSTGSAMEDVAELLTLQLKQIYEANNGSWKDAQVFQDGLITGRGYWDTRMDFSKNQLGEARMSIKNPFSIVIDPEAESYDPHDTEGGWGYVFENRWMSPVEIFMLFGLKATTDILTLESHSPISTSTGNSYAQEGLQPITTFGLDVLEDNWNNNSSGVSDSSHHINKSRKLVKVLDCQHTNLKMVNFIFDPVTGDEYILNDKVDEQKIQRIVQFAQEAGLEIQVKRAIRKMVRWTITAADRILYDEWSPYHNSFTITPFFPYFRRGVTRGIVHDLLDPQKEINRRRAARLHILMTAANSGWMFEKGSLDDENREALETMGSTPGLTLEFEKGTQAPMRINPSPSPHAIKEAEFDSTADLKEIANVNDSALGNLDKVQSGRAIIARQKQSLIGTEIYFDNFQYSREIKALFTVKIVQLYYTEERIIRLRNNNDDGIEERTINQQSAGHILNNMSMGSYGVVIDETPSSASFMEAQFAELFDLWKEGAPIPMEVLIKHSSVGGKQEIIKKIKEEAAIKMNMDLLQNIMQRMQMGIPLDQPVPPMVINGQQMPSIITPEILEQVMGGLQSMQSQEQRGAGGGGNQMSKQQQAQEQLGA